MTPEPAFMITVEPHRLGSFGYRWTIFEHGKLRQASRLAFATKREAQANADAVVQKLLPARLPRK